MSVSADDDQERKVLILICVQLLPGMRRLKSSPIRRLAPKAILLVLD